MGKFRDEIERWGVYKVVTAACMRRLERHFGVHVYLINTRPLSTDQQDVTVPAGHEIRYLRSDDIDTLAADPALELPSALLREAFDRGDICIGYFDHAKLVSYFWCGFTFVPMEAGLQVRVPPQVYSYAYKALTLESHRGRRLQQLLTQANDLWLVERGYRYNIEYIAFYNLPQRSASARYGNRTIGYAGYLRWFGRAFPFRSPGVRKKQFAFIRTH